MSRETLPFDQDDTETLAPAPDGGGTAGRPATDDDDVDIADERFLHIQVSLVRRDEMLPGAIPLQQDIRQVGVGDRLLLDANENAADVVGFGCFLIPLEEMESIATVTLKLDASRFLGCPQVIVRLLDKGAEGED